MLLSLYKCHIFECSYLTCRFHQPESRSAAYSPKRSASYDTIDSRAYDYSIEKRQKKFATVKSKSI